MLSKTWRGKCKLQCFNKTSCTYWIKLLMLNRKTKSRPPLLSRVIDAVPSLVCPLMRHRQLLITLNSFYHPCSSAEHISILDFLEGDVTSPTGASSRAWLMLHSGYVGDPKIPCANPWMPPTMWSLQRWFLPFDYNWGSKLEKCGLFLYVYITKYCESTIFLLYLHVFLSVYILF